MSFNKVQSTQESLKAQIQKSEDVVFKEIHTKEKYLEVFYIKSISDEIQLQDFVIKPFFEINTPERFLNYLHSHPKAAVIVINILDMVKHLDSFLSIRFEGIVLQFLFFCVGLKSSSRISTKDIRFG